MPDNDGDLEAAHDATVDVETTELEDYTTRVFLAIGPALSQAIRQNYPPYATASILAQCRVFARWELATRASRGVVHD
jgi:hypothetical protein